MSRCLFDALAKAVGRITFQCHCIIVKFTVYLSMTYIRVYKLCSS